MLTAKDLLADKIEGFEAGADDYLVKPFSLAELDVRLKALVRRANVPPARRACSASAICASISTRSKPSAAASASSSIRRRAGC